MDDHLLLILSAQYDSARAEQLVSLKQWHDEQFRAFGGGTKGSNKFALQELELFTKQRWMSIAES